MNGFSGAANTTISTTNNPTITLAAGSTVDYYRNDGAAQNISNATNVGLGTAHYSNLYISGTGTKTAPSTTLSILGNFYKKFRRLVLLHTTMVLFLLTVMQLQHKPTFVWQHLIWKFFNLINNNTVGGFTVASDLGVENLLTLNNSSKIDFWKWKY